MVEKTMLDKLVRRVKRKGSKVNAFATGSFRGLGYVRILAKLTSEITADGTDRKDRCPGEEVIERFFLYWIDVDADRPSPDEEFECSFDIFPDAANASTSFFHSAAMGAGTALNEGI